MDDETFSTESEPWVTVHNNRRRRNVVISGVLLVAASVAALVLGLTLYDQGGQPRGVSSSIGEPPLPPTPAPTSQTLFQFLQQESLLDGSELEDASTYQYKAYTWLASTSHESLSDSSVLQRFTLACIYYATFQVRTLYTDAVYGYDKVIPAWNQTKNWLSSKDECLWFGIQCNDNGEVMDIELYGNYLTGTFPPEIIHLKQSLITLDLYDNVIWNQGDEGLYWLEQLTNLGKRMRESKMRLCFMGAHAHIFLLVHRILVLRRHILPVRRDSHVHWGLDKLDRIRLQPDAVLWHINGKNL
jgi:hypothetical protein